MSDKDSKGEAEFSPEIFPVTNGLVKSKSQEKRLKAQGEGELKPCCCGLTPRSFNDGHGDVYRKCTNKECYVYDEPIWAGFWDADRPTTPKEEWISVKRVEFWQVCQLARQPDDKAEKFANKMMDKYLPSPPTKDQTIQEERRGG